MSNQGFNLSTKKNSGNRVAEEGVDYITVTDGNGGDVKIMNIEHEMYAPREGIIEIVPLKVARGLNNAIRHQNEVKFKVIRDRATGWLIGIPIPGYKKDKSIEFESFLIKSAEFLDLSVPKERLKWICIKNGPFLSGSPNFVNSSKTVYEAVDREKQVDDYEINKRAKRKASEIVDTLAGEDLIDMAIALGYDPKLYTPRTLFMEIDKFVENPAKVNGKTGAARFNEIYYSETRLETITLKRAISVGLVTQTLNDGFAYNGVPLGLSEQDAVRYLKQHPTTFTSLDIQSRQQQDGSTQVHEKPKTPVVKDEKDLVVERQKKEIEDLQRRLSKANEDVMESKSEEVIKGEDPELAELISEAKRLLIGAPHLIGRKDSMDVRKQKLRDKIAEANLKASN